jgi:hypothetical protein
VFENKTFFIICFDIYALYIGLNLNWLIIVTLLFAFGLKDEKTS